MGILAVLRKRIKLAMCIASIGLAFKLLHDDLYFSVVSLNKRLGIETQMIESNNYNRTFVSTGSDIDEFSFQEQSDTPFPFVSPKPWPHGVGVLHYNYVFGIPTVRRQGGVGNQPVIETIRDLIDAFECDQAEEDSTNEGKSLLVKSIYCVSNWMDRVKIVIYNSNTKPEEHQEAMDIIAQEYPLLIEEDILIIINRTSMYKHLFNEMPRMPSYSKYQKQNPPERNITLKNLRLEFAARDATDTWYHEPFSRTLEPFPEPFPLEYAMYYSKATLDYTFVMKYAYEHVTFEQSTEEVSGEETDYDNRDPSMYKGPDFYINLEDDVIPIKGVNPVGAIDAMVTCGNMKRRAGLKKCMIGANKSWIFSYISQNVDEEQNYGKNSPARIQKLLTRPISYTGSWHGSLAVLFKIRGQHSLLEEYMWFLYNQSNKRPFDLLVGWFKTRKHHGVKFLRGIGMFTHRTNGAPTSQPKFRKTPRRKWSPRRMGHLRHRGRGRGHVHHGHSHVHHRQGHVHHGQGNGRGDRQENARLIAVPVSQSQIRITEA
eukprot:Nk52_evm16s2325 gene=Nk52_evmTU16s2325